MRRVMRMDEKIPIRQGGKIVGYVNPPLWLCLWQGLKPRITKVWKWVKRQR
jgi:hypothetical protein